MSSTVPPVVVFSLINIKAAITTPIKATPTFERLKNADAINPINKYGAIFQENVSCISNANPNAGNIQLPSEIPWASHEGIIVNR